MSGEKARYRVLRLSHIHNNLWPEGSEVEYEGEPGTALEPLNDAAKLAKEIAEKRKGKSAASVVNSPVSVAVHPVVEELKSDGTGAVSEDLTQLRQQYEDLLGKKPGNKTAETLAKEIAEKRAELGV
ncbi:TPA: hypothetical protein ACNVCI_001220 [Citrobacter braakii]|uniref:hypothetical protein n=1 Tax=Enterobacteriaceae TaxID=543 RepID=UPI0017B5B877|nr:hypothetical protein [Escherichia coli]EAT0104687.1 hypothetical protein [Salmonella enterica]EEW5980725.1 hypothetical protein [Escherichia coli]EFE3481745.1 hypothetical protein [Escherichia coli]ELA1822435.1 hypothetical protein [Salmonella enterica]MCF2001515.1 hypothetical protein [Escherichia coli]